MQLKGIAASDQGDLIILATTDFHVSFDRAEGLFNEVQKYRKIYGKKTIHLDGGDLFQGSLEGNLNKGKSVVEFYNLMGVDAAAIGNHELDYGPDVPDRSSVVGNEDGLGNLKKRVKEANFKWLSSNFIKDNQIKCNPNTDTYCNALKQQTLFRPHEIFEVNANQVCVIGATTPSTPRITNQRFIAGTKFEELFPLVRAEIQFFRTTHNCDFIILMTHAGLMCDSGDHCQQPGDFAEILELLQKLPVGSLDAVVAGHTHLKAQEFINGTPVIEAGKYGQYLGILHLYRKSKKIPPHFEPFVEIQPNAQSPLVESLLRPYRENANTIKSRVVGSLKNDFHHEYNSESALGNLLADSLLTAARKKMDVDFALINSGGIRHDIYAGPVTYGNIFRTLPFDNSLCIVELKGSEFKSLIQIAHSGSYGMPPISGFKIERYDAPPVEKGPWDRDINGDGRSEVWERNLLLKITDLKGRKIEDQKIYKIATIDFMVSGAERQGFIYEKIPQSRKYTFTGVWVRDLFENYLKEYKNLSPTDYFDPKNPRVRLVPTTQ